MPVKNVTISSEQTGQRLDNYLISRLKGLPKSRLYRALRKGEVRVNGRRVKPDYRIQADDLVRIPPLRVAEPQSKAMPLNQKLMQCLEERILFEDQNLMLINKPSGLPVHGGTNISAGLIETLRVMRPKARFLELVHRLDRGTSGCLLIAKKRRILLELHQLLTQRKMRKQYLALVRGQWRGGYQKVTAPLRKFQQRSGERIVIVDQQEGKAATTLFKPIKCWPHATLVEAIPVTGRTHQIRVHATFINHPIAGDEKYGDKTFNRKMRNLGLRRLFLHSASLSYWLEDYDHQMGMCALLDQDLIDLVQLISQR